MKCKHKRTRYTGETIVRLDSRAQPIRATLVYVCCKCGKEVPSAWYNLREVPEVRARA